LIRLAAGTASLVGRVRSANEDSVLVTDDLVVVADGMGGHLAGEVASADAVEVLGGAAGRRSLVDLVSSVHLANRRINDRAAEDEQLRGMGTTVCALGVVDEEGEHLAVLNVGDSRVYLYAGGVLTQLTEDHSLVETLVREGRITAEDAEVHPQRNVLTRALGVEPLVVVDAWLLQPADGDRLLLCSDGLFNELSDERIAEVLAEGRDPEATARQLAAEADAAGGRDNITVVVVDVHDTGNPPEPLGDRYRRIATPAVDLDDLGRDPSSDTATVPMVSVAPAPDSADDAPPDEDAVDDAEADGAVEPVDAAHADEPEPADDEPEHATSRELVHVPPAAVEEVGRRTWRTPLFLLAVLAVLGVAFGVVAYTAQRGWFIGADGDRVALYKGPTESFLWFGPRVAERTDIELEDLRPNDRLNIERRRWSYDDRADAEERLRRLERSATTTTTSTTTTTTTTAAPPPEQGPAPTARAGPGQ